MKVTLHMLQPIEVNADDLHAVLGDLARLMCCTPRMVARVYAHAAVSVRR